MPDPFQPILAAAQLMQNFPTRWFVSGGWAIDLFLDEVTRSHFDIEIGIDRADQQALHRHLTGWSLDKAIQTPADGQWVAWELGEELRLPVHQVRARRADADPAEIEFFLNERAHYEWRSRRHPQLTRPVAQTVMTSRSGLPILVPEIQLLFKAKQTREKDHADFERTLPRLDEQQRCWLAEALRACHPGHPWLALIV